MNILRIPLSLFCLLSLLTFTGCIKTHLSLKDGHQQLAPLLASDSEEVQFINYAVFWLADDHSYSTNIRNVGFVALTSSHLILARGVPSDLSTGNYWRMPLSKLDGVARFESDLQFLVEGERLIVYPYSPNPYSSPGRRLDELALLLEEQSIPTVEPVEVVDYWSGSSRYSGGSYSSNSFGSSGGGGSDSQFYKGDGSVRDSPRFEPLN